MLPASPLDLPWGMLGAVPFSGWIAHLIYCRVFLNPIDWQLVMAAGALWMLVELVFYLVLRVQLYTRIEKLKPAAPNPRSPRETIGLVLGVARQVSAYYPFAHFISKWFKGAAMEDLWEDNIKELLAWAGYHKTLQELTPHEAQELHTQLHQEVPSLWTSHPLKPGYNPAVPPPMRMTLEPLQYYHRPLFGILAMKVLQATGAVLLLSCGYARHECSGLGYWFREGPRAGGRLPLLFFHGISPGLSVYSLFVTMCTSNRACVLFETPHIAMALQCFDPLPKAEMVQAVRRICDKHQLQRVCVGGQSFGSIHAGWVMEGLPDVVAQGMFLDPVNFLLCCPDVAYNFLYRPPCPQSLMELLIYYLAAREVTVANTLRRHFWWYENLTLLEDVHCPLVIALAEKDEVAPAHVLKTYITHHQHQAQAQAKNNKGQHNYKAPVELVWWRDFSHAHCLVVPWALRQLDEALYKQEVAHQLNPVKIKITHSTHRPALHPTASGVVAGEEDQAL